MAGSPIADPTEAVDRFLGLREVVEVGLLAAFTEVLEPCLDVANLAEVVDAADLMDDVDPAFFVPVTEVVEVCSDEARGSSPAESCVEQNQYHNYMQIIIILNYYYPR